MTEEMIEKQCSASEILMAHASLACQEWVHHKKSINQNAINDNNHPPCKPLTHVVFQQHLYDDDYSLIKFDHQLFMQHPLIENGYLLLVWMGTVTEPCTCQYLSSLQRSIL